MVSEQRKKYMREYMRNRYAIERELNERLRSEDPLVLARRILSEV